MGIRGVVDLGDKSAEQLERQASGLEPGWFRATLADIYEEGTTLRLKFVLADGRQHTDKLNDPQSGKTDASALRMQQRKDAFAVRMGLVPKEAKGTAEFDWCDAIGNEYVLHLVLGKPDDNGQRFINIEWMGIFDPDDDRVPEPLRGDNPRAHSLPDGNKPPNASPPATNGSRTNGPKPQSPASASAVPATASSSRFNMDDL